MLNWHRQWSETNDVWSLVNYIRKKGRERMDDGLIKKRDRENQ